MGQNNVPEELLQSVRLLCQIVGKQAHHSNAIGHVHLVPRYEAGDVVGIDSARKIMPGRD